MASWYPEKKRCAFCGKNIGNNEKNQVLKVETINERYSIAGNLCGSCFVDRLLSLDSVLTQKTCDICKRPLDGLGVPLFAGSLTVEGGEFQIGWICSACKKNADQEYKQAFWRVLAHLKKQISSLENKT